MTKVIWDGLTLLTRGSVIVILLGLFVNVSYAQMSAPTLSLTTSAVDGVTTIVWSVSGAVSCIASQGSSGWIGIKSPQGGSQVVKPTVMTAYAMECWNTSGLTSGLKRVIVGAVPVQCAYESFVFGPAPACTQELEGNTQYGSRCTCTTGTTPNAPTIKFETSNSASGPWAENASLCNDPGTKVYTRLTGVSKANPPKGCTDLTTNTNSGCFNPANHRIFTNAEWLNSTTIQTVIDGGLLQNGPFYSYVSYPEGAPIKVGSFQLKQCANTTTNPVCAYEGFVTGPAPACTQALEGNTQYGSRCTCESVPTPTAPSTPTTPTAPTTPTDNTAILALINQLMAQIASLQAQLIALQQGTTPTAPTTALLTQNLSLGNTGAQVTLLQTKLAALGYLDDENISGYFGPITEAAVKKFQCDKNIVCTGTLSTTGYGGVGTLTRAALNGTVTGNTGTIGTKLCTPFTTTLNLGDGLANGKGEQVKNLQKFLMRRGIFDYTAPTGEYGKYTQVNVSIFQKQNGLPQTGVVDAATIAKINPICLGENAPTSIPTIKSFVAQKLVSGTYITTSTLNEKEAFRLLWSASTDVKSCTLANWNNIDSYSAGFRIPDLMYAGKKDLVASRVFRWGTTKADFEMSGPARFTLVCTNGMGYSERAIVTVNIKVDNSLTAQAAIISNFTSTKPSVGDGDTVTLSWNSPNATGCTLSNSPTPTVTTFTQTVLPNKSDSLVVESEHIQRADGAAIPTSGTARYKLICTNSYGPSVASYVDVAVNAPVDSTITSGPTVNLQVVPSTPVYPGDSLTYKLTSTGAKSCRLTSVRAPIAGTMYDVTTTYLVSADNKTSFTATKAHTPGKYTFYAQCFTELNGLGTKTQVTKTVTVGCAPGSAWDGSSCVVGSVVSAGPAPTAKLTFTFDSVTGGTATSKTTSKTINEKCYIQPGKSNCSVTTSWTTENATHAVLTFPDLNRDYPDLDLYNDPRFRTEGLTGSRTMRLERKLATPHPGYNIGGLRETLILNNSADGQSTTYNINLTAVCADGVWDSVKGICPPTTGTTPTPVEPAPEPTPEPSTTPTASLTISPTGTITYPTVVTYKLSSTNAQSCSIVDYMGVTYVAPSDNLTNKTITSITTPQSTVFSTKCWSGLNGTGTVSPTKTSSVLVKCPTNTAWSGTVCK